MSPFGFTLWFTGIIILIGFLFVLLLTIGCVIIYALTKLIKNYFDKKNIEAPILENYTEEIEKDFTIIKKKIKDSKIEIEERK